MMQYISKTSARKILEETRASAIEDIEYFTSDVNRSVNSAQGKRLDTNILNIFTAQVRIELATYCADYLECTKITEGVSVVVRVIDLVEYLLQETLRLGRTLPNKSTSPISNMQVEYRIQACAMFVDALTVGRFEIKER